MSVLRKVGSKGKGAVRKLLKSASPVYRLQKGAEKDIAALRNEVNTLRGEISDLHNDIRDLKNTSLLVATEQSKILESSNSNSAKISNLETKFEINVDPALMPRATGVLRDIQDLSLGMLEAIDRICKKHKLEYWLDFGTLIGAVRHKGFVPWDDDMDISMMNSDYEKLVAVIDDELADTPYRFIRVPSQIGKVVHKDFMPHGDEETTRFINWDMREKLMFALDIFPYYYAKNSLSDEGLIKSLTRGSKDKTEIFIEDFPYSSFNKAERVIDKVHGVIATDQASDRIFMGLETIANRMATKPWIVDAKKVFPLKKSDFEGRQLPIPNAADVYLLGAYGDYMQLPGSIHKHLHIENLPISELEKLKAVSK